MFHLTGHDLAPAVHAEVARIADEFLRMLCWV